MTNWKQYDTLFSKTIPEFSLMDQGKQHKTNVRYTGGSNSLCAPDDYSTKNMQKYFKQF
jgi:hypothetical protein